MLSLKKRLELVSKNKWYRQKNNYLVNEIENTQMRTIQFTINLKKNNTELECKNEKLNPLIWQFGHVIFFYINHTINNLNIPLDDYNVNRKYIDFYDSFLTKVECRTDILLLLNYTECYNLYNKVII